MKRRYYLWLLGLMAATLVYLACPRPPLYPDATFSALVTDRHDQVLRLALADDQRYRLFVPLTEIAKSAQAATLLYEDRYFRLHPGFNPGALLRAAWSTYVAGARVVGGSTITMQLARLRFALGTQTIPGKLMQIARAMQLERHYSKAEILEAYLNLAPYGGNVEGIGTAALVYFDKRAADLSLPEALALSVIPQNPVIRNPARVRGYTAMLEARQRLFELWRETHRVDADTQGMFELPLQVRPPARLPYRAPHFVTDYLQGRPQPAGVHRSTLDLALQTNVERHVQDYVARYASVGITNAAAMLVNHETMEVLALIGSADFFDAEIAGQVNGVNAKRSPGSALKPFLYGLAMDRGLIHPMTLLKDAPKRYSAYTPENFDRRFMGPVFARDALIYSRNVPAVGLLARLGESNFHQFLEAAQVTRMRDAAHYGLALALGGNEVTMEELARLYALLANGGRLRALRYGFTVAAEITAPRLLSPEASFMVLDMLRDNPRPDEVAVRGSESPLPIAWKTGTSFAYRDAWTVGVFGPYVLAIWVGNFDGTGNPAFVGRQAAAPLFFQIADALSVSLPERYRHQSDPSHLQVRQVEVCASTGDLPGRHCPDTTLSWFVPGVSPIKISEVHRAVRISKATGFRSCRFDDEATREEVFEFWPSDLAAIFRQAGISIRRPPRWEPGCSLDVRAAAGIAPKITSPESSIAYSLRTDRLDDERVIFTAVTDADADGLYWFVNERFVGQVERDEPFFWEPQLGDFTVLAVDDLGRSAASRLYVRLAQ
jgi:penicillin-binding protein 1C